MSTQVHSAVPPGLRAAYLVGICYLLNQICIDFCSTRFVLISFKSVFHYRCFLHFHHCQWNDFQQNFLLPKLHFYFKTTLYKRRRFVFASLVNKRGTKKVYTGPLFLASIRKLWRVNGDHKLYTNNINLALVNWFSQDIFYFNADFESKHPMQKYSANSNQAF